MYRPNYRVKKNGVPILKREEIDIIGENFVMDYQPEILTEPGPVDVERFVEYYLGMTTDYQYLSHNGIYLGMTVFNDTKVPIYSPETQRAEYISAKARTVIIDNNLLEESQTHRYRFTLGHEGGHDIFHTAYYAYNPNQESLFLEAEDPMIRCRVAGQRTTDSRFWNDEDWMEWQANAFSSAFLMPTSAVYAVANCFSRHSGFLHDYLLVHDVARIFDVSTESATYRLQGLGLINRDFKSPSLGAYHVDVVPEITELRA